MTLRIERIAGWPGGVLRCEARRPGDQDHSDRQACGEANPSHLLPRSSTPQCVLTDATVPELGAVGFPTLHLWMKRWGSVVNWSGATVLSLNRAH